MAKKWWLASAGVTGAAVVGVVSVAVLRAHAGDSLIVDDVAVVSAPSLPAAVVSAPPLSASEMEVLRAKLDVLGRDRRLGQLVGSVRDVSSGDVVWEKDASVGVRPASTTKVLTAAAALLTFGLDDRVSTDVFVVDGGRTVVLVGGGDVGLSGEQLDDLAGQVRAAGVQPERVVVDASVWSQQSWFEKWGQENIAEGFIAPIEPAMLYGARVGAPTGDVPRSDSPSMDVAREFASRLGVGEIDVDWDGAVLSAAQGDTAAADSDQTSKDSKTSKTSKGDKGDAQQVNVARKVASVQSARLVDRVREMMLHSDNVLAESLGRQVAVARGVEAPDAAAAGAAVLATLSEAGFDVQGVHLDDCSGMSDDDRIPASVLSSVLAGAGSDARVRLLPDLLPVAHGSGTLASRFDGLDGAGWVRAKTGTLTTTSGLAGVVTADSGRVYSFGFVSNESEVLPARAALDELASVLREG